MTPSAVAGPGDETVEGFLRQWLAHVLGRVRPRTYKGYESLIRLYALPSIGPVRLPDLGPLDLQRFYAQLLSPERALSSGTVLNLYLVLTNALEQAVRWELLERNPATGAQPPDRIVPSRW